MQISLGTQILSFAGAVLILVAYVAHQTHTMDSRRVAYNLLNTVGAAILAWIALRPLQVGFVVLEVTWTLVSAVALVRAWKAQAGESPAST